MPSSIIVELYRGTPSAADLQGRLAVSASALMRMAGEARTVKIR
jgi:hypothetical protein